MTNSTDQTGSTQIKQIYPEIRCTHMYRQAHIHLKRRKKMLAVHTYSQIPRHTSHSGINNRAQSTVMRNALLFFLTYSFKNEHRVEQRGKPSVFLDCKSLSRVSFGCLMPAKGHYLQTLDAGKSFKKKQEDNSGKQPRSEWKGKLLDAASTAGTPLCFTLEYCSPTTAGGLPTDSNGSS